MSDMSDDLLEENSATSPKSGLISKVLTPAIKLWLKSQTQHLDDLKLSIQAGDRQLLSGQIPKVEVSAKSAVYQGIHISELQLSGANIKTNLSQVMRGKALKLLAAFPIEIQMVLSEDDLNQSLTSPIVQDAVSSFLLELLGKESGQESLTITNLNCQIEEQTLLLSGQLPANSSGDSTEIALRSGLQLTQPNELQLHNPVWLPHAKAKRGMPIAELNGYRFDLGPDTQLDSIQVTFGKIACSGKLMVLP